MEKKLVPWVVLMMALGLLYAFDNYYDASGVTGRVINSAAGIYDCSDTDNNEARIAGVTTSDIYEDGYAEDTCVGNDLLEYYCSGNGPDVRVVKCRTGCFAGACN